LANIYLQEEKITAEKSDKTTNRFMLIGFVVLQRCPNVWINLSFDAQIIPQVTVVIRAFYGLIVF